MQKRPQWLNVCAAGEDFKLRIPASPTADDVRSLLAQAERVAEYRTQEMDRTAREQRYRVFGSIGVADHTRGRPT